VALILALLVAVPISAHLYTAFAYAGLTPGMTRSQVDRCLWAFSPSVNQSYTSAGLGDTVINYELLGLGKWTTIMVIFRPDGTSAPIPVFDN
jgi:hypothetical protein